MLPIEQEIYNTYLAVTRSQQNKPFKLRKNFIGFENTKDYIHIKRLANLFRKFPQIDKQLYFKAPFQVYKDDKQIYDLSFFSSMKGLNVYTTYFNTIKQQSPDSPEQLEFIRKSLKFIGLFCLNNKINISQYTTFKTNHNYNWIEHLSKNQISVYILLAFPRIYDIISSIPRDEIELFLQDLWSNFTSLKSKLDNSKEAKFVCQTGINKLNEYINSELNKNNN